MSWTQLTSHHPDTNLLKNSACSLWKNVATLFSDADSPYRVLMGKPPGEVKMDDVYDTFMPYRQKGKTVRGELSTRTVYYVACMKIRNRESNV